MSEPNARKYLQTLAKSGLVDTDDTGQGTRYKRSRETVAMTRIHELHAELTDAELVDGIRDCKATIDASQAEYDVTNPTISHSSSRRPTAGPQSRDGGCSRRI